jgi:hypothetical protein
MQNLDVLGAGPPDVVAQRLLEVARPYARPGRPIMPMFELIATIAHPFPTPGGLYRTHQEDAIVRSFLEAVRRIDGVLVLEDELVAEEGEELGLDPDLAVFAAQDELAEEGEELPS